MKSVSPDDLKERRPHVLSLLCIITFTFGIFRIIVFSADAYMLSLSSDKSSYSNLLKILTGIASPAHALIFILITILAILGAWLMWKLNKRGFYLYTSAAILAYIFPAIIAGNEMMTIQRLFFSSTFILFYGIHLKFMN
jgi:hypothetical protein